ncbi:MAG: hypothetical protein JW941_04605 [Candidatus Coatesbacteria bacterium]|nr:hypothetical protein [Candidatus Coatesbacteria bacterium]
MSSHARPRSLPFILLFAAILIFALALFKIANYDIWFLLKTGELILETNSVPTSDPFSYTSFGKPWIMHEWLFCVVAELVRRHLGLDLLVILKAVLVSLAFTITLYTAAIRAGFKRNAVIFVASFLVMAAGASRFRFIARPHIANLLGIALTLLIVEMFFAGRKKSLFLIPALVLLWVNMQAGAIICPVYIWLRLFSESISRRLRREAGDAPGPNLRPLLTVALAATGILFINPYGARVFDFIVAAIWEHGAGGGITVQEWLPPDARFKLFWVLLVVVWGSFIAGIKRRRLSDWAEIALATALVLSARRYIPVFFLLTIPLFGRIVSEWWFLTRSPFRRLRMDLLAAPMLALACVISVFANYGPFVPGVGVNLRAFPHGAVEFVIKNNVTGNMYNSHRFGGYIIYRTYPERKVFVDGRNVVHKELWREFATRPFEQIADGYGVDYAIVDLAYDSRLRDFSAHSFRAAVNRPDSPQAQRLVDWWNRHRGWHLVFWDDNSAVYVDGSEKFKALRDQFEYRFIDPAAPGLDYLIRYLSDKDTREMVIDEAERAANQSPNAISCLALYARLASVSSPMGMTPSE